MVYDSPDPTPEQFKSSLVSKTAAPIEHQSYLDYMLDGTVGRAASALGASDLHRQDAVDFAKTVTEGVFFFAPGKVGYVANAVLGAADSASTDDSITRAATGALLGAVKNSALKSLLHYTGNIEMASSVRGVTLGIASRAGSTLANTSNYFDSNGHISVSNALQKVADNTFDRASIATDVLLFGISDWTEGNINYKSAGAFRRNASGPLLMTAGTTGAVQSAMTEIGRQRQANDAQSLDYGRVLLKSVIGGSASAISAVPGARMMENASRLPKEDLFTEGKVPVQLSPEQIALRDGSFTPIRKLSGIKLESYLGAVAVPDGTTTPAIFRVSDGTAKFQRRVDAETTNHLLSKLMRFEHADPAAVAATAEIDGVVKEGYLQTVAGQGLDAALAEKALATSGKTNDAALHAAIYDTPALSANLHEAIVRRQAGPADHDGHTLNYTADANNAVGSIDLQYSFPAAVQTGDLIPRWEKQVSVVSTLGGRLRASLSNTPIPADTRSKLSDFVDRVHGDPSSLLATGLSPQQARGVLGRSEWFVGKGVFPSNSPNYFYESLNRLFRKINNKPQPDLNIHS